MEIETLVQKAKAKDEESINELVRRFTPLILKTIKNIYIKGYDRDDLIQLGYFTIIKAIESYKITNNSSFTAYVSNAIRNNYYYHIRKISKENYDSSYEKIVEKGEFLDTFAEKELSIEDIVLKKERIKNLKMAIEKLSPEDRELILFSYNQGHGALKKYSKLKGIKYGTVQKRKRRILEKVKKSVQEQLTMDN